MWKDMWRASPCDCGQIDSPRASGLSCAPGSWDNNTVLWGFPGGAVVKNLPVSEGDLRDMGSIPGSGRSPGGRHGNPLQCSCLENPMDRGAWQATVRGVTKSQAQLKQQLVCTYAWSCEEQTCKCAKCLRKCQGNANHSISISY